MRIKQIIANQRPFFMVIPAFLWQGLFFYIPLFFILILSIVKLSEVNTFEGLTLQNYVPFLILPIYLLFLNH